MYWTLHSVPELAEVPQEERGKLWREHYWKSFRHWQVWVALIVCGFAGGIGSWLGNQLDGFASGMMGATLGGGVGGFVFGQVATVFTRRSIRKAQMSENAGGGILNRG